MLIVSSNLHHSFVVGELEGLESTLKVTVLGVRGTKVRLGFEIMPEIHDHPADDRDPKPDASSDPAANQGMDTTQVWDWPDKDDLESKPQTDR